MEVCFMTQFACTVASRGGAAQTSDTLSDERLVDIQQDIASFNDHSFNRQILANVFCFTDLVLHHLLSTEQSQWNS